MALEPLSIRDMEKRTGDQYEAVVVMSKRAKQVLRNRIVEDQIDSMEEVEMGVYDEIIEKILKIMKNSIKSPRLR